MSIRYVTYTHTNCTDVWPIYFEHLSRYGPDFNHTVMCNEEVEFPNAECFVYDDDKNYCQEYVRCLNSFDESKVIYMQEDFYLYDKCNGEEIEKFSDVIDTGKTDFIRFLKSGFVSEQKTEFENLYYVIPPNQIYQYENSYSMQPTLWNKKRLIDLYEKTKLERFNESVKFAMMMNELKIIGMYYYNGEPKRGLYHCDSSIFPYIATAVVKGKWNISEYPELESILKENKIDISNRGIR